MCRIADLCSPAATLLALGSISDRRIVSPETESTNQSLEDIKEGVKD